MHDTKVENFLFDYILRRENIQKHILGLHDTVMGQNISLEDKKQILERLIGNCIVNETSEIHSFIETYRKGGNLPIVYRLLLGYLESIIDVDDTESLNYLLHETSDEVEVDTALLFSGIIQDVVAYIQALFQKNESIIELFSKDFLSDEEKNKFFEIVAHLRLELDENGQEKVKKLKEKIASVIEQNKKIRAIS